MEAEVELSQGRVDEAVEGLERAAELDPTRAQPHFHLGTIHQQLGRIDEARRAYARALEIDPGFALAANNLAWLEAEEGGDLDRALLLAERAREALPNDPHVLDTLGWVYFRRGQFARAVQVLERSVRAEPGNADRQYHLGRSYYEDGRHEAAAAALERSLALDPGHGGAETARQVLARLRASDDPAAPVE